MSPIPAGLSSQASLGPAWADWISRLPRLCTDLIDEWDLAIDGDAWHGFTSIVLPVRSAAGPAALKVTFDGDDESLHEGLALQHWAGNGTVQLLRADPHRRALLLERLHDESLIDRWDVEACEIIAGLYARIHVPALPQLRTLTSYLEVWNEGLRALPRDAPVPRRLVDQARSLSAGFIADPSSIGTMIHGDLHYENVLAADREPWLVIDPKPMSGDPHYEIAPLLWNRWEEMAGDLREGIRRRFHTVIDTAALDEDRARDWVIVRTINNVLWTLEDPVPDKSRITHMIAIAKAVQD